MLLYSVVVQCLFRLPGKVHSGSEQAFGEKLLAFFGQSAHFKEEGKHRIDLFLYLDGSLIFNSCCVLSNMPDL